MNLVGAAVATRPWVCGERDVLDDEQGPGEGGDAWKEALMQLNEGVEVTVSSGARTFLNHLHR